MAFVAGDDVCLTVTQCLTAVPMIGVVESTGPTVVAWPNGKRVSYADDTNLFALGTPVDFNLLHRRVRLLSALIDAGSVGNAPAAPNGQRASEGVVIGLFRNSGNDIAVVKFTTGDIQTWLAGELETID